MYKKRENNLTYFLGGAAVGVAAGFLVGKLLSNKFTKTQTFEPSSSTEKYGKKYSQDDNIHSLNRGNPQPCHTRSKSESQYENEDSEKPATTSTVFNDSFMNNLNNLTHKEKDSTNIRKICYNNFYNISVEDNADYGSLNEADASREKKERNDSNFSESKSMKMINTRTASLGNVKDKNSSEALNKNLPRDVKTFDSVKFAETSNNLPKIVLAEYCNSILDFKDDNESEMLNSKNFCETD